MSGECIINFSNGTNCRDIVRLCFSLFFSLFVSLPFNPSYPETNFVCTTRFAHPSDVVLACRRSY